MTDHAGQWGPQPFIDRRGNALPAAIVYVYEIGTSTLAPLWRDRDRAVVLANPLPIGVTTGTAGLDDEANGLFFADPGRYRMVARIAGISVFDAPVVVPVDADDIDTGEGTDIPQGGPLTEDLESGGFAIHDPTFTGTVTVPDGAFAVADTAGLGAALTALQGADSGLQAALTAEASTRGAADTALAAADTAEASARATADGLRVLKAGDTMSGELVVPDVKATGKTGATASPAILAGGTVSGAPTTGAHVVGEFIVAANGDLFVCTVAGTPGTWVPALSGTFAPLSHLTALDPHPGWAPTDLDGGAPDSTFAGTIDGGTP